LAAAQIGWRELRMPLDVASGSLKTLNYEIRLYQEDLDQIDNVGQRSFERDLIKNRYNLAGFVYV
jgi:hypothetical protein